MGKLCVSLLSSSVACVERRSQPTDDVAYAIGDQVEGRNGGLLGISGDVGADERQQDHERTGHGQREIEADQAAERRGQRQRDDEDEAQNAEAEADHAEEDAAAVAVAQVAADAERNDLHCAAGRAVQQRLRGRVAE